MITNLFIYFRLGGPEPLIGPFLRSDLGKIDFEHAIKAIQILQYWFITQTLVSNLLILHTAEDGESESHKGKNNISLLYLYFLLSFLPILEEANVWLRR